MSSSQATPKLEIEVNGEIFQALDLEKVIGTERFSKLPFSLKVLAENILRKEPDAARAAECIEAIADFRDDVDLPFRPERVVLQDMLGTAALVDLAALRDEVEEAGGSAKDVNPAVPTHLVVDHSLNVDVWRQPDARQRNEDIERKRNAERFRFLGWASKAFDNLSIIGSGNGILHQINIERLTPVVGQHKTATGRLACPDTVVGTDSHTPMINAIGVLGWGVGGLEAEVAMLGKPLMMRLPEVVGIRLDGALRPGILATDLALALTEMLREAGVVGAILEFYGAGVAAVPLTDRATVSNMAPEFGATAALFPIDDRTLSYMALSGRSPQAIALTELYAKATGLWSDSLRTARYHRKLALDLSSVQRSIAGPRQPHERIGVSNKPSGAPLVTANAPGEFPPKPIVIAAITSCTNTSNPRTVITAALLARNARRKGMTTPSWVRTSFAPGSRVVSEYLKAADLQKPLDELGFNVIGFGCTTCNGLSGPMLDPAMREALNKQGANTVAVTSGNRNFEGRVHPDAREVYIMSPPLIVAYALAGSAEGDIGSRPLGTDQNGRDVFLRDLWPADEEVAEIERNFVNASAFNRGYSELDASLGHTLDLTRAAGPQQYGWEADSTYIRRPQFWSLKPNAKPERLSGLRPLVILGDHITTDHISPSGTILPDSDAGVYLRARDVSPADFNSYGSRRGNYEAAMRATFASPRLKNEMLDDGAEGPLTVVKPDNDRTTIFKAAEIYSSRDQGLIVVAGQNYGSGSSRDWAAKGPHLLGVRVVLAESYERIHRQNLAAIGILPLQFEPGVSRHTLGLTGDDQFDVLDLDKPLSPQQTMRVRITRPDGSSFVIDTKSRLETAEDVVFFQYGGLLPQLKAEGLTRGVGHDQAVSAT